MPCLSKAPVLLEVSDANVGRIHYHHLETALLNRASVSLQQALLVATWSHSHTARLVGEHTDMCSVPRCEAAKNPHHLDHRIAISLLSDSIGAKYPPVLAQSSTPSLERAAFYPWHLGLQYPFPPPDHQNL